MLIIYVPSIKKNLDIANRDYHILVGIDIIIIDYIINFLNENLIYMPFRDEEIKFINKVKEVFNNCDRFKFNFFSMANLTKYSKENNSVLITDVLKIGIYFSLKFFKPSFCYIPFLLEDMRIKDSYGFLNFINVFTDITELKSNLKNISFNKNFMLNKILKIYNTSII